MLFARVEIAIGMTKFTMKRSEKKQFFARFFKGKNEEEQLLMGSFDLFGGRKPTFWRGTYNSKPAATVSILGHITTTSMPNPLFGAKDVYYIEKNMAK